MADDVKARYRRYLEQAWTADGERLDALAAELVTPDFVIHQARSDGASAEQVRGPAALTKLIRESCSLFRDVSTVIEVGPIVDGDLVAARWRFHGRYVGGMPGATAEPGTEVRFAGTDILRSSGDRFAEYWVVSEGLSLMAQLGVGQG
ncbi:SnoaL-like polyketide cyclase [Micromonospora viridifaciens]|uniref:SnoaL-like polyketide cyclase n=1 Tax=Micromonospora viridifaciens TaxID=1881 RepID=A0A1C4Y8Q6_MICVI|nr:ester cyclase [Micromonospora viridifaciens]SCF17084.1 SnoaL-like polyketide cyclase [Micromonospora viridifaciens]